MASAGVAFEDLGRFSGGLRLAAEVYNLLDEEVSDIDYLYESRIAPGADAREGIHFYPAEPCSVRLVLEWRGR